MTSSVRPGDEGVPADMAAAWRAAEARLYAGLVWDPDLYELSVALVARVLERLRGLGSSFDVLIGSAASPADLVLEAASEAGIAMPALDLDLVGQAALAMRLRELVGEHSRRRRLFAIAAAAEQGVPWVVLEESGDRQGDPLDPYRRLEVEVSTGRALYVEARPDDTFTGVVHEVTPAVVDLDDGGLREAEPDSETPPQRPAALLDWLARERWVDQLRSGSPAT